MVCLTAAWPSVCSKVANSFFSLSKSAFICDSISAFFESKTYCYFSVISSHFFFPEIDMSCSWWSNFSRSLSYCAWSLAFKSALARSIPSS